MKFRSSLFIFSISFLVGCAQLTHKVEPYPSQQDPQHDSYAYQAGDGGTRPADQTDAARATAVALIDTLFTPGKQAVKIPSKGVITGSCDIISNEGSKIPCFSILILLKSIDGIVLAQQRTNEYGKFIFEANKGGEYFIEAKSEKFTTEIIPATSLGVGSTVKLRLHGKN